MYSYINNESHNMAVDQ